MIVAHLVDGTERTLSIERDDAITAAVHTSTGFVNVHLIAEAGSKGRRWKVEHGPGRGNLDLT